MGRQRAGKGQAKGRQRATIEEGNKGIREEVSLSFSKENDCRTDVQRVIEAWNSIPELNSVTRISSDSQRYQRLKTRISEYGVEGVLSAIDKIKSSDFLLGKKEPVEWFTFDWFVKPNNFPKVMDGNYDKKVSGKSKVEEWLNGTN